MSAIGADLPPHLLAKRKRLQEVEASNDSSLASGAKRSPSPDKRRKVMGPAMPPAPLNERPEAPSDSVDDESSDDDDGFGPMLPTGGAVTQALNEDEQGGIGASETELSGEKLKRDEWMMMPPKQDDLAARLDPTKQRPSKFNTSKSGRASHAAVDDSSTWHETAEEKRKRLEDEMMGTGQSAAGVKADPENRSKKARDEAAHRKIQEHNESRGPSLVEQHQQSQGAEAEDDPSKRAFDREKDMASGSRISTSQKREMVSKAANYSGKFSGGTYL